MEWIIILFSLIGVPLFSWLLSLVPAVFSLEKADKRDAHLEATAKDFGLQELGKEISMRRKRRIIHRLSYPKSYLAMAVACFYLAICAFLSALLFAIGIQLSEGSRLDRFGLSFLFLVLTYLAGIVFFHEQQKIEKILPVESTQDDSAHKKTPPDSGVDFMG